MIFNTYAEQRQSAVGMKVVSCGHIFAESGREILRPAGREDWLLFYVAKESETFYFEGAKQAQAGSFVLYAPGEKQHHKYTGNKTAEFYYIHFRCAALPDECSLKSSQVYELPPSRYVCSVFEELIEEMLQKQPNYERLCIYKLLHLLTVLEREVIHTHPTFREGFARVALAVQHINRYYNSDLSLADYAAMCSMSKYHFLRVFEQATGSTPLEYRAGIRLEHAAELLRDEEYTVEQIAEMTGYSSVSYFSTAFKRRYGLSPKKYQFSERGK